MAVVDVAFEEGVGRVDGTGDVGDLALDFDFCLLDCGFVLFAVGAPAHGVAGLAFGGVAGG